jgi:hypothetical protein
MDLSSGETREEQKARSRFASVRFPFHPSLA